MGNHLFDLIRSRMPAPDAPFALLDDGRRFSYGDMVAASARFANALVGLGVKPGDRVAVQVEKSFEALMLYLGTVRAGAIFLPLNTAYTPAEIEYFLGDAEPAVFVCDPAKAEPLRPYAEKAGAKLETLGIGNGSLLDKANAASSDFTDVARGPDDLAAILYTSGTTGRSKGAMLSHDNLSSNALALVDYWRFTKGDVLQHA
jgi:malonyl-CoA/methylmalonyl-CoA synthetase